MNDHNLDKKVNLALTGVIDGLYDTKPLCDDTPPQASESEAQDEVDVIMDRIMQLSHDDFMRLKERLEHFYEET